MKKCSREKGPPKHIQVAGGPGGQEDQGHGVVLQDQGEEYQQPINSISLSYSDYVLNRTKLRSKYQSLGLTLLNARSSFIYKQGQTFSFHTFYL